ncbi:MAG: ribose 5-phosphate isomerase B [Clostridia bacterium]|nr:ribose 5-phosphate isomerase B [Clostridia bacterium]
MKIAIGCDHGGINLKPALIKYLNKEGVEFKDFGCYTSESVDYNDYALKVANAVAGGEYDLGILICGTGIGMSIMANKVKGIRCAHCSDPYSARLTREHNDANVLAFGERVIGEGLMVDIVEAFIKTPFSNGERHVRRVNKIKALEDENFK